MAAALAGAWLLAACAPQSGEPRPPEIVYGQDMCDACGMIIDDARFAAATLTEAGQTYKFDDIGDMLAFHQARPAEEVRAWFVHDYESEAWLRGEAAFYVVSPQIVSPMGHGIAAFEQREAAEAFAGAREGQVLTFTDLQGEVLINTHGH